MWIYLKYLLFPFSIIYGFITSLRNFLYDYNILESKKYNVKVISIGNLVMGGSGKTPMVEYVSRYFIKKNYKFSIIRRGYKRLTKGLRLINESDTYLTVGDEPKQLYNKFGNTSKVIVSEDRHKAIKLIDSVAPFVKIISLVLALINLATSLLAFSNSNVAFSAIPYAPLCIFALY